MMESINYRSLKLRYLFLLLIIHLFMTHLITPLFISYLFEEQGLVVDLFAQILSFILPILIILVVSSRDDEHQKKSFTFQVDLLYKQPFIKKSLIISLPIGLLLSIVVTYSIYAIEIIYILITNEYTIISIMPTFDINQFLLAVLTFALLPACFEELLYRGMYYDTFKSENKVFIYLIPTTMFVFAHTGMITSFIACVLGILLIHLMLKGISIIVCTVLHFVYNATALFFSHVVSLPFSPLRLLSDYASREQMISTIVIYLGIILILGTIILYLLGYLLKTSIKKDTSGDKKKFNLLEKSLILVMIITSIVLFVYRTF